MLGLSREYWLVAPSDDPIAALHAAALLLALLWAHGTRRAYAHAYAYAYA